jgi:phage gp29-like protein
MNKRIRTYSNLVEEKQRLELKLKLQKQLLMEDIDDLKEQLAPVQSALSTMGKLLARDGNNFLLNAGTGELVDWVIRKGFLSRAGWLSRIIIPFMIKNYSSHFIAENKNAFFNKLFSWIGKKNANGHEKTTTNYN